MSMQYIRDYYGVPAKRGMSVRYDGKYGIIVGSNGAYLRIRLDGERYIPLSYHPTYKLEYIGKNGSVIWPKEGER